MRYQFEFRPYQRRFVTSVTTSHGIWDIREGIILRLTSETGQASWGEIAPISWFGSETLKQANYFCHELPKEITDETIFSIPEDLPSCQFGFESAMWGMRSEVLTPNSIPLSYSALLPSGEAALEECRLLWKQGYRTFKWKIGVEPISRELEIFALLTQKLPVEAKLRLDANGGLSYEEANTWLWLCDKVNASQELPVEIEFIEQPLPVGQFQQMLELCGNYTTAIALDESVATLNQLENCFKQGWQQIFVIKPGIVGSPSRLRQFCLENEIDAVFSSVLETAIGRQNALQLAAELSLHNRAVGFGVNHWFDDDEETWLQNLWNDH
ncbi:MAG: o-succinylbenzoate synthase [Cyanomargarita calcarea GSE-NOS-MK-12-04C]|jgi:O-succinylbenzoate synthase|uniref:o-succinylbenzoate synthase n=1 Tax=Cyanomargarita calcarea GSE-NOS-MK-12-04C TaxID=2839659 RepID=A0A951QIN6_9CYAN|nr:o-succinylbenzoate synthase [Cyanomargarita calcarea GSE-NOS-MK-12-04C]